MTEHTVIKKPWLYFVVLLHMVFLLSCGEEFIEQQPVGMISDEMLFNAENMQALLIGAYASLNGSGMYAGPDMPFYGVIHRAECSYDVRYYRQDQGGSWSSKHGFGMKGEVNDSDASGQVIKNPARANHDYSS